MTNKQLQIIRLHRVFFGPLFTTPTLIEYYSKMSPISDETTQTFDDTAVYPLTENAYERLKKEETRDLGLTVIRFENEDIVCTIEEAKELHLYQPDAKVRIQYGEWHNLSIAGLVRLQNANPEDPSITRELQRRLNKEGLEYCAHNLAFYGSSNKGYIAFSNALLNRPITCKEYKMLNRQQLVNFENLTEFPFKI